jgi:hypothetical protein
MSRTRLANLDAVLALLNELEHHPAAPSRVGPLPIGQALNHCAESVECSVSGFPGGWPPFLRATLGRLVLSRFLKRGQMSHDLEAPVPGLPMAPDAPLGEAILRLRAAIARFRAASELEPHAVYGLVDRETYDRVHAMHIADHLGDLALPEL